jgi:hypothetical protein
LKKLECSWQANALNTQASLLLMAQSFDLTRLSQTAAFRGQTKQGERRWLLAPSNGLTLQKASAL